jgi:hypothetical protein
MSTRRGAAAGLVLTLFVVFMAGGSAQAVTPTVTLTWIGLRGDLVRYR